MNGNLCALEIDGYVHRVKKLHWESRPSQDHSTYRIPTQDPLEVEVDISGQCGWSDIGCSCLLVESGGVSVPGVIADVGNGCVTIRVGDNFGH